VLLLTHSPRFAKVSLGGDPAVANVLAGVFTLGIAVGSLACARLSGRMVEIGLVPFGSIGMTLFGIDLYWLARGCRTGRCRRSRSSSVTPDTGGSWSTCSCCRRARAVQRALVCADPDPLGTLAPRPDHRANNIINALFMIVASFYAIAMLDLAKLSVPSCCCRLRC